MPVPYSMPWNWQLKPHPPTETGTVRVTLAVAEESIQQRAVLYDKEGDAHFDTISAFIKSLRGSDPDALYTG
jgi:putative ATPase